MATRPYRRSFDFFSCELRSMIVYKDFRRANDMVPKTESHVHPKYGSTNQNIDWSSYVPILSLDGGSCVLAGVPASLGEVLRDEAWLWNHLQSRGHQIRILFPVCDMHASKQGVWPGKIPDPEVGGQDKIGLVTLFEPWSKLLTKRLLGIL